jgi:DNA polymerase III delta prime subunit
LSAISSGVKDIREVIQKARFQQGVVLFIDEIHRFNKSQQDALLGAVEKGIIRLIGATTENPSFEVNAALLSRCQVFTLNALDKKDLEAMMQQALEKDVLLKKKQVELKETDALLRLSGGDGRKLLNLLEIVVDSIKEDPIVITNEIAMEVAQRKVALYDKSGEQHYDIISAFIKSIIASDPNGDPLTFAFGQPAGGLSSNGVAITWSGVGTPVLFGYAGGELVILATVTGGTGSFTITLFKAIDHPNTAVEDELTIKIALKQSVDQEELGRRLSMEIRDAIRLTAMLEFVDPQNLPEDAPLIEDRRTID